MWKEAIVACKKHENPKEMISLPDLRDEKRTCDFPQKEQKCPPLIRDHCYSNDEAGRRLLCSGTERPNATDVRDNLQIWSVAMNIINKQLRTADKG
jgi:hypothetical protein